MSMRAFVLGLMAWAGLSAAGQEPAQRTSLERLEAVHLEATHEARVRFARERSVSAEAHGACEDFRAVIHLHAEDAEHTKGTRAELLEAARKVGARVVMTTDHRGPKPEAWRGMRDGVLFIAGSEAGDGLVWFPEHSPDGKPIPNSGLRFLSHVEERLDTGVEGFVGMEICNRHADANLDKGTYLLLAAAMGDPERWKGAVELYKRYPDEFFGAGADYRPNVIGKWDSVLRQQAFTGIGANDSHQNLILQGVTFDTYEVSLRHMSTHILARELTEESVREALRAGRAFVAYDWLCDPTGFAFGAVNNLGVFLMGDSAPLVGTKLVATTPLAARLKLVHNGAVVHETTGTNLTFEARETGPYRLEAWLPVDGEHRPWILSNPVFVRLPVASDMRLPPTNVSPEIDAHRNISYQDGPAESADKHRLDVYAPKGGTNVPVFFFVHGGAWKYGDRALYPALGNRYAKAGVLTVIPSYRLAPTFPHPAQIEDVAAAFAWTVRHAADYGGDTNRIYVGGHSAGGHLAALLTLNERHLGAHNLSPAIIRGVMAMSGVYNLAVGDSMASVFRKDVDARRDASPLFHVKAGAPPFLVTYCQWDYFTLPFQARQFHAALCRAGVPAELVYVPGENHISEMCSVVNQNDPTVAAVLGFIRRR